MVLIFLLGSSTPSTGVMAVWSKETNPPWDTDCGSADAPVGSHARDMYDHKWCHQCSTDRPYLEHGYTRPCFDAPFIGLVSICANLFGFVGTLWYNSYFSHWSYKQILYTTQVAFVVVGFTDLIWVYRWNRMLGISDDVFVMGQEVRFYPNPTSLSSKHVRFQLLAHLSPVPLVSPLSPRTPPIE